MAYGIFVKFIDYQGSSATVYGESVVKGMPGSIEALSFSSDVEQTLNIGSQSSGAGAGKVSFGDIQFTKNVDSTSSALFGAACAGRAFKEVDVTFTSPDGSPSALLRLGLVAVKSIGLAMATTTAPLIETVTLNCGSQVWVLPPNPTIPKGAANPSLAPQAPPASFTNAAGWDRVHNTSIKQIT
jgi:type VI protein secretion system component Hcp